MTFTGLLCKILAKDVIILSNIKFKGIFPAIVTPLTNDFKINKMAIKQMLDYNYENGADGFYICGSTGEGPVLTTSRRKKFAEAVIEYDKGRGAIINHVGAASFEDSLALAHHAADIGCDAVSSVVPNFYFKHNENEVVEYYKRLADAAGIPVIAYAQGLLGDIDVVSLMEKLMKVDNIIGVKFTLLNFYDMSRIKSLCNGDINVINGPDEMLICGLTMGADAGIGSTYNVMCREFKKLYNAFAQGNFEEARQQQFKINKVIEIIIKYGVIRTVKHMLSYVDINAGDACLPAAALSDKEKENIKAELNSIGYFNNYNN